MFVSISILLALCKLYIIFVLFEKGESVMPSIECVTLNQEISVTCSPGCCSPVE